MPAGSAQKQYGYEKMMNTDIGTLRSQVIDKVLLKQDDSFRWGHDEKQARQRPEYLYYSPNFKSTLWTLLLLADLQAPLAIPQVNVSIRLICDHFYDPAHGVFRLPGMSHFPIPCLNGNMIYLQHYFGAPNPEALEKTIAFFADYQRFDDGDYKTPDAYPYAANGSCYGSHTCFWGVTKLLKGISFIPREERSSEAQQLIEKCIDYVLQHEVCFSSRHGEKLLNRDIGILKFPNFYKSDFLEILWLLAREGVHDRRMRRALELLRSKMKAGGTWELEKAMNTIVPIGEKGCANAFITERASTMG